MSKMQEFVDQVGEIMKDEDEKTFTTIRCKKEEYSVVFLDFDKETNIHALMKLAKKHGINYEIRKPGNWITFIFEDNQIGKEKLKRWKEKPWKVTPSKAITLSSLNHGKTSDSKVVKVTKKLKEKGYIKDVDELEKVLDEIEES